MTNEELVREGLVSIEEAMEFLSMSRASLYRLIDGGTLPPSSWPSPGYPAGRSSTLRRLTSSSCKASRPEFGRPVTIGTAITSERHIRRPTKTARESDAPTPPRRTKRRPRLLTKVCIEMDMIVTGTGRNDEGSGEGSRRLTEAHGGCREEDLDAEAAAWRGRADDLARWVLARMVVRDDAYGKYYIDADGRPGSCKQDGVVDVDLIECHFASNRPGHIIGLYSTGLDDRCLYLVIDFDRHDGDPEGLAEKNRALALSAYETLRSLGFHPLLIDSNGNGGLHLIVLFASPVPARQARQFGRWSCGIGPDSACPRSRRSSPSRTRSGVAMGTSPGCSGGTTSAPLLEGLGWTGLAGW